MGQVFTVLTGGDPFEADRRSQYEWERKMGYNQCKGNLKKDAWQVVSGRRDGQEAARMDGFTNAGDHMQDKNCQPGRWLPPSQRAAPAPAPPRMQLTPPGDLRWGNR